MMERDHMQENGKIPAPLSLPDAEMVALSDTQSAKIAIWMGYLY
jgi:hypothetical protein